MKRDIDNTNGEKIRMSDSEQTENNVDNVVDDDEIQAVDSDDSSENDYSSIIDETDDESRDETSDEELENESVQSSSDKRNDEIPENNNDDSDNEDDQNSSDDILTTGEQANGDVLNDGKRREEDALDLLVLTLDTSDWRIESSNGRIMKPDTTRKIDDVKVPVLSNSVEPSPSRSQIIGMLGKKADNDELDAICGCRVPDGPVHKIANSSKSSGFFRRKVGYARVANSDDLIVVSAFRKLSVVLIALILAIIALLVYSAVNNVSPIDAPAYFASQTGIGGNGADPSVSIEYATYESIPDQNWKAGETEQDTYLALPAKVSSGNSNSSNDNESPDNPVVASPSIYVDVNKDGKFSENECYYNPIKRDSNGKVSEWTDLVYPGNAIRKIDLVKPLKKGKYDACVTWTSKMKDSETEANPMTFNFKVTVS